MDTIPLRIMLIDDNPDIHQDVIKVLTMSNRNTSSFNNTEAILFGEEELKPARCYLPEFIFDTASQGQEGVHKIKLATEQGKPYALAFVDIRMPPGWDGIETIQHIWKIDPNIQIIICTAYSDYNWEKTIDKLGISDNFLILKKPFDNMAVRQLACALTRKWELAEFSRKNIEYLNNMIQEKTRDLQYSVSLLRATLESSTEGVLVVDLKGKIIDYNTRFTKLFDIPKSVIDYGDEKIVQEFIMERIKRPQEYSERIDEMHQLIEESNQQTIYLKNGKIIDCVSQPHCMETNTIGRVFSFRDVSERAFMEKKLEYQATHDTLTNLPNRLLLYDRINQCIANSTRNNLSFTILFFDLDRFKLVNDSLGHEYGDQLICMIAKRLKSMVRYSDTVARLGGDEFVILLPALSDKKDILQLVKKIITSLQKPFLIAGYEVFINTSIGVSIFPKNGKKVSQLLKHADMAMYQAKERGSNQFQFYNEELNKGRKSKLALDIGLRQALENKQFFLVYQPQLNISNQDFLSLEALIRWQHPEKGLILPLEFIPEAEESGLIVPIGYWVIHETCRQIKAWHQQGLPWITVAVNVTAQQLKQPNFDQQIQGIIEEFDIPLDCLEIEITENVVVNNKEVTRMLNKLGKMGFKIILDDFGIGNSSLNYLTKIKIDRLKIDHSFVKNISICRSDEVIIEAVIAMAKNLDLRVLAEGVEAQNQIDFLKTKSCDEVQGYFYSKPLNPESVVDFVQEKLKLGKVKRWGK